MQNTVADTLRINPGSIDEDHIHVVAAIIWKTTRKDQFLISQRPSEKHLGGYWEFPGGKVESGESTSKALARELIEEIGIEMISAEPFMQVFCRYPERNILLDTWIVSDYRGKPLSRESQDLVWISLDEIENYAFPMADIPILEALKRTAG